MFNGPVEKTKFANCCAPCKALLLRWIKQYWDCITLDTIRKSFKKCGITSALDGTEDDLFQMSEGEDDGASVADAASEFEGFSQAELNIATDVYEYVACVLSEESCSSDSETECDTDYYSPGL